MSIELIVLCAFDFQLSEADDSQMCQILMDEKVLDILHVTRYNGVPSREDSVSVKEIIEYV